MLNGDLGLGCERCAVHVDHGQADLAYARVFDHLVPEDQHPQWPQQLELALSNSCNLQCVMCNGELSSAIRIHRERRSPMPQVYDDDFFEELEDFLPHLRSIVFLGGEPFLAKESMRVMDRLVDLGLSPSCSITTNGTQWSERVERMVSSVEAHVAVSFDGVTQATFEAIRQGADFDTVVRNIDRFREATSRSGGGVSLSSCLMRNNWHELGDLLLWADDMDLSVYVNSVEHPPDLSLVHAPSEELRRILRAMERTSAELSARLTRNRGVWLQQVQSLRELLSERETTVELTPRRSATIQRRQARAIATIEVGSDQLIASVEPGATRELGLDLPSMSGSAVWDLQPYLCAQLGRTLHTALSRFDNGEEELRISYERPTDRIEMAAHLTPHSDGGQTWTLRFQTT
jgi:molybdenum cofactor biosynthesis enzyme MoaA